MAKLWEEKRLDQWKCRNVQSPSSRPSHQRAKSKGRRLQKSLGGSTSRKLWRQEFGLSSKMLNPNFYREAKHFSIEIFKIWQWIILIFIFQPKGFSSWHSLVQKSDASPLDLGIVWTGPNFLHYIASTRGDHFVKHIQNFIYDYLSKVTKM